MNKKMVLMAVLLVNMVAAVFGTDFEERISRRFWLRDYFNEVIYRKDRNIIVEYRPRLKEEENIYYYDSAHDDMIFWFDEPYNYIDRIECAEDDEYGYSVFMGTILCGKAKELTPDLYELQIEDVRISQEKYEFLLKYGYDMKFALDATEPEYSLYFRFDGEYLYIYLEDGKTLYATYCAYDGLEEEDALYEAIKTNEFDMTKITFPYHADGTCDYERGGGVPGKKIVNGVYRAQDNLRLRANENTSGEVITTMQAGSLVLILSKGREETIDGITDNWVEVELQWDSKDLEGDRLYGKTGWCFGGYLR